jgi:hypothetical protein
MNDSTTLSLFVLGYVVGLPVLVYGIFDLTRIPAHVYNFTPYSRRIWVAAFLAGYACFGLGAMFMVFAWLNSPERTELRDDAALDQRWDRRPLPEPGETTRAIRRRERARRHRWAAIAVSLPVVLAVAATAIRVG